MRCSVCLFLSVHFRFSSRWLSESRVMMEESYVIRDWLVRRLGYCVEMRWCAVRLQLRANSVLFHRIYVTSFNFGVPQGT